MAEKRSRIKKIASRLKESADIVAAVGVIGAAAVGVGSWIVHNITAETNARLDAIVVQLDTLEQDSTRSQLLTLMSNYSDNESEIMKIAYHYFRELGGDWYMTDLFIKWASDHGIDISDIVNVKGK